MISFLQGNNTFKATFHWLFYPYQMYKRALTSAPKSHNSFLIVSERYLESLQTSMSSENKPNVLHDPTLDFERLDIKDEAQNGGSADAREAKAGGGPMPDIDDEGGGVSIVPVPRLPSKSISDQGNARVTQTKSSQGRQPTNPKVRIGSMQPECNTSAEVPIPKMINSSWRTQNDANAPSFPATKPQRQRFSTSMRGYHTGAARMDRNPNKTPETATKQTPM